MAYRIHACFYHDKAYAVLVAEGAEELCAVRSVHPLHDLYFTHQLVVVLGLHLGLMVYLDDHIAS